MRMDVLGWFCLGTAPLRVYRIVWELLLLEFYGFEKSKSFYRVSRWLGGSFRKMAEEGERTVTVTAENSLVFALALAVLWNACFVFTWFSPFMARQLDHRPNT